MSNRPTPPGPMVQGACGPRLIVFSRYPRPREVKSRLIPALGPQGAAELHDLMTRRVLTWARLLRNRRNLDLEVSHTGGDEAAFRNWLGEDLLYAPQHGTDLGARMGHALGRALAQGAPRAVLIGTDLPQLDDNILEDAFNALDQADLVLGPAGDGGYYLVGFKTPQPGVFEDMPWGGRGVQARTLQRAAQFGLKVELLPQLSDVDQPQDLEVWKKVSPCPVEGRISVIIPCLNEADNLAQAVQSVRGRADIEILAVDGGSQDGTRRVARSLGIPLFISPPGRGLQMAKGAEKATGEYLLFLHADTRLLPGWDQEVVRVLGASGTSLGAFTFKLDQDSWGLRLIERMVAWRAASRQMPYGDQALFVRASLLRRLGGFPRLPLMEDVELVRRARARGRVEISPLLAVSSARRWQKRGTINYTLRNWSCFLAYSLGVSPARLSRWYYGRTQQS